MTIDSAGTVRATTVPAGQGTAQVTVARRAGTPILAYPITSHDSSNSVSGCLRPAGAFVNLSEPAVLAWEEGPTASIMMRVAEAGRDISLFNGDRLADYLAEKVDPWVVDIDSVAERIAFGDFGAYDIDELSNREVTVTPGVGTWFLESPFAAPAESDPEGRVTLPGVTLGEHALCSTGGRLIRIHVDAQEVTLREVP